LDGAVRPALPQFGQGSLLERVSGFVARRVQLLAGAAQYAGAGVLGAVDPVAETHEAVAPVEEVEKREGDATTYVKELLDKGERLMGFGHRVYRAEDPRARVLRRTCQELNAPRYEAAMALEQAALAELRERRPDRAIETNVEFWAAVILDFADVPPHMMPAMFTSARTAGWSAHIMEQKKTGRLVRPSARYIGPDPRKPSDVDGWGDIAHT
ncbi:MAG: citrate synthase, partial [Pseudonocardiales bacterium]|nr:citrate synthase [Pseudonocardiales bacterium]